MTRSDIVRSVALVVLTVGGWISFQYGHLDSFVSLATVVGVGIAADQLFRQVSEHKAAFEDSFAKEYREIVAKIPVEAMLGDELSAADLRAHLDEFYNYFDLCNEQVFLANNGRIRRKTWEFWREGMLDNFRRAAFRSAWQHIEQRAKSDFSALRPILRDNGMEA